MEKQIITTTEDFQVFELWAKYKHFWPLVLLSISVFVGIAFVYIKITPPSYLRKAQVMIRENSGSAEISSIVGNKLVLNMSSSAKNEVEAFKSVSLIREVVSEMNMLIRYSQKKVLTTIRLYDRLPVEAIFPNSSEDESFNFRVELSDDNSVVLSKFEYRKNKYQQKIVGKFGETIKTPIGDVIMSPTRYYQEYNKSYPLIISKNSIQSETRSVARKLKASRATKEVDIIDLEFTDNFIPTAEKFLNLLIEKYNKNWIEEKNLLADFSTRLLEEKLPKAEHELRMIEDELERYKKQNMLTDIRSSALLSMNQSSDIGIKIMDVNLQLSIANNTKDNLPENNDITSMMPSNFGINNSSIEMQMLEYNKLLMDRDRILAGSSERNEAVITMNNRLQSMRQPIVQAVNRHIETLKLQLSTLKAQESQMRGQIASNPGMERQLETLDRERKTKEAIYMQLMQKKEENELMLAINTTNLRIISPPSGSNSPISPKRNLMLMIALTFGLAIPCGFIWTKENFNTVIRGKNDLEGLSVPLLGVIALAESEDQKNREYMRVSEIGRDLINETFRMVRTNMDFTCGKNMKVILFTSFEPGCGKTFVALNLAMSFALTGKKIALVDADLRTATLSKVSELSDRDTNFGYCNYLNKNRTYAQLMQYDMRRNRYYKGFDIFPVGAIPLSPTELLMSDQFKIMIEKLRNKYDYVFLDCTPLDIVTDATIVSKLADLSVFIVREDFTDRRKLRELEGLYKQGQLDKKNALNKWKKIYEEIEIGGRRKIGKEIELGMQSVIDAQEKLNEEIKSGEKAIQDAQQKLSEEIDSFERNLRDTQEILNKQRESGEMIDLDELRIKEEMKKLDALRKSGEKRIKEEQKKLEKIKKSGEQRINNEKKRIEKLREIDDKNINEELKNLDEQKKEERIQFGEMALILNGAQLDISFNKHHTRYQKKIENVAKQIRGSDRMKELPKEATQDYSVPEKDQLLLGDGKN